jgi:iron complex transport system ATP-binding protein
MQEPIISLSKISFRYAGQDRTIFQNLSLEIQPGTITAILGPNGSGKTTLLHLILGHLEPTDGIVLLGRRPRQHYSRRAMGKLIGLVSQDEYIPFNFSVLEYVLLGRAPHLQLLQTPSTKDVNLAQDALRKLEMTEFTHTPLQSLSGGERQLVMVARALVQDPSILLLDEPTSHLDLSNRNRVLDILRTLANQNKSIIFTTQNPEIALAIAEYSVLVREGKSLTSGKVEDVLTASNLTATYGVPIEVYEVAGKRVIIAF